MMIKLFYSQIGGMQAEKVWTGEEGLDYCLRF